MLMTPADFWNFTGISYKDEAEAAIAGCVHNVFSTSAAISWLLARRADIDSLRRFLRATALVEVGGRMEIGHGRFIYFFGEYPIIARIIANYIHVHPLSSTGVWGNPFLIEWDFGVEVKGKVFLKFWRKAAGYSTERFSALKNIGLSDEAAFLASVDLKHE